MTTEKRGEQFLDRIKLTTGTHFTVPLWFVVRPLNAAVGHRPCNPKAVSQLPSYRGLCSTSLESRRVRRTVRSSAVGVPMRVPVLHRSGLNPKGVAVRRSGRRTWRSERFRGLSSLRSAHGRESKRSLGKKGQRGFGVTASWARGGLLCPGYTRCHVQPSVLHLFHLVSETEVKEKKRLKTSEEFSDEQPHSPILKGEDIQALAIRLEDLEKLRTPQPPQEKAPGLTRVLVKRRLPQEEERKMVRVVVARPIPPGTPVVPLDYTGLGGPRFDAKGMILPHSILGSLEDFRKEMETRGEMELARRVPVRPASCPVASAMQKVDTPEPLSPPDQQVHALRHWKHHMNERRRQQDFLSQVLDKPVQNLLMNQSSRFRETQEERELISRGLPALLFGQAFCGGSEFWNIPKRIGDELSGIMATLTQTERGNPEPIAHIGLPRRIREESGSVFPDDSPSVFQTWDHSLYLQQRRQELKEVLKDLDFNQPDRSLLGRLPFLAGCVARCPSASLLSPFCRDALVQEDDVPIGGVLVPALRFCGQPARWTGSPSSHRGELGIAARLTFEAPTGRRASSNLELQNEGNTALYYSWKRLALPHSYPEMRRVTSAQRFYFNGSTGVILPGETRRIQFIFKSTTAGIFKEMWGLNTHPVLLGGALVRVTLWGVALCQDKNAERRQALQLIDALRPPERPRSPAELYVTEEQHFHTLNPKAERLAPGSSGAGRKGCRSGANPHVLVHPPSLHFHHSTVEQLKRLWGQATGWAEPVKGNIPPEPLSWDLSVSSLRQALLTMPEGDCKEEALVQFNALLVELHGRPQQAPPLSPHAIGPVNGRSVSTASGRFASHRLVVAEGMMLELHSVKRKVHEDKRPGKPEKEPEKEPVSKSNSPEAEPLRTPTEQVDFALKEKVRRHLHRQVHVLMEALVDSLCELLDEAQSSE
ncbi:MYCBP-associated protein-like [Scleropages formosus]|uniref:MYCBP-associated protein-like n=1 Tax=Scleropages formosus TaxID=113540 RepID=A0A0P7WNZ7_SCLFO|nr:MYCBP-associated protein-like [Scleropages formosus]